MDIQAKDRVDRMFAAQVLPPPSAIKFKGWSCLIDDSKLTTNPVDALLFQIHEAPMKEFLARPDHLCMTETGFDLVDWWTIQRSLDGFLEMFWVWASKHMSHFCGVGWMQKICGFWDHGQCPHCQQENETMTHVLLCSGNGTDQEWSNHVLILGLWLAEVDRHPAIHHCIIASLSSRMVATSFVAHVNPVCIEATEDQDIIGWQNFMEGKIAKQWGTLQLAYYHE